MNVAWCNLILYWIISGIPSKKSASKETYFKQFVFYWLPLILTIYLLGPDERFGNSLIAKNETIDQYWSVLLRLTYISI